MLKTAVVSLAVSAGLLLLVGRGPAAVRKVFGI